MGSDDREVGVDVLMRAAAAPYQPGCKPSGVSPRRHPGGICDALGHVPGPHAGERGHLGWLYVSGMSPAWIARSHGVTPEAALNAAAALGCAMLKVNGVGWRDAQGRPGPEWDRSLPWESQASPDQLAILRGPPGAVRPRKPSPRRRPTSEERQAA